MPCLSMACPVAAARTENSTSPMSVTFKRCLLSGRGGLSRFNDFAISCFLMPGQAENHRFRLCQSGPRGAPGPLLADPGLVFGGDLLLSPGRLCGWALAVDPRRPAEHIRGVEVEIGAAAHAVRMHPVVRARPQHAEAVADAAPQVDRRRVRLVTGGAGYLADPGARGDRLGDDLVVEDEVVGIAFDRQAGQQLAAEEIGRASGRE